MSKSVLQTTFMFWDLDYVGMDFSQENSYQVTVIPACNEFKEQPGTGVVVQFPMISPLLK